MALVLLIVLVASASAAIWLLAQRKGRRIAAWICVSVSIGSLGVGLGHNLWGVQEDSFFRYLPPEFRSRTNLFDRLRHQPSAVYRREWACLRVAAWELGRYLAEKRAGSRPLLVVGPIENQRAGPRETRELTEGLALGLGIKLGAVAVVPLDTATGAIGDDSAGHPQPIESWWTPAALDRLIDRYAADHDLVVLAVGLPDDVSQARYWSRRGRPRLAMMRGSVYRLRTRFSADGLVAAAVYGPWAIYGTPPPRSLEEAFQSRFLLVTYENVNEVARKYGDLFP